MRYLILILGLAGTLALPASAQSRRLLMSRQLAFAGGGGGVCPADGSPNVSQTGGTDYLAANSDIEYIGQLFTTPGAITLCKVRFKLIRFSTGHTITARVFSLSGTTINPASPLAVSDSVLSDNISASGEDVIFTFSSPANLTGSTDYAIVVTSDAGGNSTLAVKNYKAASGTLSGRYGGWRQSDGTMFDPADGSDCEMALYWY